MNSKKLILFYSYTNNTRKIAEAIEKETGFPMAEIETCEKYSGDYNSVVSQGKKEVDEGFKPKIKKLSIDLNNYDTIILGTPVWWYTFAPAVKTFLEENNLSGKTIIPFATNGGWIGHTIKDIEKTCPDFHVKDAINIEFNGKNLVTDKKVIKNWIENIKF